MYVPWFEHFSLITLFKQNFLIYIFISSFLHPLFLHQISKVGWIHCFHFISSHFILNPLQSGSVLTTSLKLLSSIWALYMSKSNIYSQPSPSWTFQQYVRFASLSPHVLRISLHLASGTWPSFSYFHNHSSLSLLPYHYVHFTR